MSRKKAQFLVGIDTHSLIWVVRKQGPPEDLDRAKWLFETLKDEQAQVVLSSIIVAEYLVPAEKKLHPSIIDAISDRFIIKPFDIECASLAAELFKIGQPMRPKDVPGGRQCLKADTMIVATAVVHKVKVFYAHDEACRKLAAQYMDARPLPNCSPFLFTKAKKN